MRKSSNSGPPFSRSTYGNIVHANKYDDVSILSLKNKGQPATVDDGVSFKILNNIRHLEQVIWRGIGVGS